MIGTIRKHTGWLWAVIITATIISFIYWGTGTSRSGSGGGGVSANYGTVYGKKVTREEYGSADRDFLLSYWFRYGTWPEKGAITPEQLKQQVYLDLMFAAKADKLGIHVSDDDVATAASQRLAAMGRNGQSVPLDALMTQVLTPAGFTVADFYDYIRRDLIIQQLSQTMGLPGLLVTPQEATAAYQHDHEELSAQVVFFSLTNYLSSVQATPAAIGQFYTNYMAAYRLPDRVRVSYVVFNATNYLARSKAEFTNLTDVVEANFQKVGETYHGAKSAAEARAKISEELLQSRALADAKKDAYDFASQVFDAEPTNGATPDVLASVAGKSKLNVYQTAPFAKDTGPDELENATTFTQTAFELSADSPISGPVVEGDLVYVLALNQTLPSRVPSFAELQDRVALDYKHREAALLAERTGAQYYQIITNQMASGHSFAAACVAAGLQPVSLPPFSIMTQELPELGDHATLGQIKSAAFTTPLGKASPFERTQDGGFILSVRSKQPADPSTMAADLPQFIQGMRRQRQNEAFAQWYQSEANSVLQMPKE